MPFVTRKSMLTIAVLSAVAGLAVGGFVWSGMYNVGADDQHMRPTYAMLRMMRERSIIRHTREVKVPALTNAALISQGAGNYDSMCTGCHLAPGKDDTELSKGLYPAPPNFSKLQPLNPAHAFWVTKHGIKASGMPAWGRSMDDEFIWGMVAFLQQLPKIDAQQYQAMVAGSGGHAHGGGETMPLEGAAATAMPDHNGMKEDTAQVHPPGTPKDHHGAMTEAPKLVEHRHADGTVESHPAPMKPKADDGHDHEH